MNIYTEGDVAHLQGDLTHSGVTDNIIHSLAASLQKVTSGGKKNIHIDCRMIGSADTSGLQLLYVWMQCARFRGVEPKLINLSVSLRQTMQGMGLGHCFTT
jgi:anti-anti-sigma regulatory factor